MVAFYRDALDAGPAVDVPGTYAEFATAGALLALCGEATMGAVVGRSSPRAGDAVVVCLRVDDVDATHAKLAARGMTFVRTPHDQPAWHQRVAHLRDPAGNLVELWTPLASPARAGT
jgi:predicted enzyme related to lactoylglutathione lyase